MLNYQRVNNQQLAFSTRHRAIHIADALQLAGSAGGLCGSMLILTSGLRVAPIGMVSGHNYGGCRWL